MTSIRNAVAAVLIGAACLTGLTACGGGGDKVTDSAFITKCKKETDQNATTKAYGTQICTCVQDGLKAQGLGDKSVDDKAVKAAGPALSLKCAKQALQ
jgi:hypothetical protein